MSAKSILKSVNIKEKHMGKNFVSALENAQNKHSKDVVLSKVCETVKKQDIKKLFGE